MRRWFFMISFLLINLNLHARTSSSPNNSCTAVDLRESKCLPPVKVQSDTNFCFAFAAAEAVSFRLCKEVSPVALGIFSSKIGEPTKREIWRNSGGWPAEAIEAGNKSGFCLESEVPSQLVFNDEKYALQNELVKLQRKIAEMGDKPCDDDINQITHILPLAHIADILNYVASQQTKMDIMNLVVSSCKNPLTQKVTVKSCEGDAQNKLRFVNENIGHGPVPLGIKSTTDFSTVGKMYNNHAVTVVGRKLEDGVCKYLIRDSAGIYALGGMRLGANAPELWISEETLLKGLAGDKTTCDAVK